MDKLVPTEASNVKKDNDKKNILNGAFCVTMLKNKKKQTTLVIANTAPKVIAPSPEVKAEQKGVSSNNINNK